MNEPDPELHWQQPVDEPAGLAPEVRADGVRVYRDVAFAQLAGYRPLRLHLTAPAAAAPGSPVPVVVYLHGGAWLWGDADTGSLFDVGEALLAQGIAFASIQYRLAGEAVFPKPARDVAAALRWIAAAAPVLGLDADRIGILGESAGGHLALIAAANTGDPWLEGGFGVPGPTPRVHTAVGWYPVTDLELFLDAPVADDAPPPDRLPEARLIGAAVADDPAAARRASPVHYANAGAAPTLLIHGDADRVVDVEHSRRLAAALEAAGADVRAQYLPGADHVFGGVDPAPAVDATVGYFAERLLG